MKAILSYNKEYYENDIGIFRRIDNNYNNSKKEIETERNKEIKLTFIVLYFKQDPLLLYERIQIFVRGHRNPIKTSVEAIKGNKGTFTLGEKTFQSWIRWECNPIPKIDCANLKAVIFKNR